MKHPYDTGSGTDEDGLPLMPRTRGDCMNMPRPCPFVSCRHHLAIDVHTKPVHSDGDGLYGLNRSRRNYEVADGMRLRIISDDPTKMAGDNLRGTCALDMADMGRSEWREMPGLSRESWRLACKGVIERNEKLSELLLECIGDDRPTTWDLMMERATRVKW